MNSQVIATADRKPVNQIDPIDDRGVWRKATNSPLGKVTTFPREESSLRYFHQAEIFVSGESVREAAFKKYLASPRRLKDPAFFSATTMVLGEFRAQTPGEVIAEIRQRSELARLREENEELRAANRRLQSLLRKLAPRPSGRIDSDRMERQVQFQGFELPQVLAHFGVNIERSRAMLDLDDDWDGEGSPRYAADTWQRAVGIAIASAREYIAGGKAAPPAPAISKGPEGSVDILWRFGTRKLMSNVPVDPEEPVTFHGFDSDNLRRETQGVMDVRDSNEWLLSWLLR